MGLFEACSWVHHSLTWKSLIGRCRLKHNTIKLEYFFWAFYQGCEQYVWFLRSCGLAKTHRRHNFLHAIQKQTIEAKGLGREKVLPWYNSLSESMFTIAQFQSCVRHYFYLKSRGEKKIFYTKDKRCENIRNYHFLLLFY